MTNEGKDEFRKTFAGLDPVRLLREIRTAQQYLAQSEAGVVPQTPRETREEPSRFIESMATVWRDGEVRPTHRKPNPGAPAEIDELLAIAGAAWIDPPRRRSPSAWGGVERKAGGFIRLGKQLLLSEWEGDDDGRRRYRRVQRRRLCRPHPQFDEPGSMPWLLLLPSLRDWESLPDVGAPCRGLDGAIGTDG